MFQAANASKQRCHINVVVSQPRHYLSHRDLTWLRNAARDGTTEIQNHISADLHEVQPITGAHLSHLDMCTGTPNQRWSIVNGESLPLQ
jgi:hypothetical protein